MTSRSKGQATPKRAGRLFSRPDHVLGPTLGPLRGETEAGTTDHQGTDYIGCRIEYRRRRVATST